MKKDQIAIENKLLLQLESSTIQEKTITLWFLGGTGFVVKTVSSTLYIDPYFTTKNPPWNLRRAIPIPINPNHIRIVDAVISTHEHPDHCDKTTIVPIGENTNAVFMGPWCSVELVRRWGFPQKKILETRPHQTLRIKDHCVTLKRSFLKLCCNLYV